ncbi:hypothetical protein JSY36_10565 [Bacillus sp. H-16]|uniref:hypothetical protein n=1 Tax=Alteribacter salitolerans TaxID=2912333 RepID=UPI001965DC57|nr:hypothetical protein [Alteribacter salitolerans]MBM7096199.1 hypothetical protein [Alteribacter salitolerans]
MLPVTVNQDGLMIGELRISFERTLRITDDEKTYPLPPSLGTFPVCRVSDYKDTVPEKWLEEGGVFIPVYQREAMWLSFSGTPHALIVDAGNTNAVSGKERCTELQADEQNYVVAPDQPWLDGFNAGKGYIRQFVAMPVGQGYSVEEQLSDKEPRGGLSFTVFAPKPGRVEQECGGFYLLTDMHVCQDAAMGIAAGGKMEQEIYPDQYGVDAWDRKTKTAVRVHFVNSEQYERMTGDAPPDSPVTAEVYTEHGFPWFRLYDEGKGDLAPFDKLSKVKSVKDVDKEKRVPAENESLHVPDNQIVTVKKN